MTSTSTEQQPLAPSTDSTLEMDGEFFSPLMPLALVQPDAFRKAFSIDRLREHTPGHVKCPACTAANAAAEVIDGVRAAICMGPTPQVTTVRKASFSWRS